ncbi:hypothetical protein [Phenylobacterium sp.]|uniref:hypothetical protein n=1 Tax=Phenylobacterium sp. TaxID=1871053 RepID=UPI0025F9693D|nr:hypothetical protein [Phenylobacterium sp.]MBX3485387.1 hypothetical protein [Phenylobacterium sp.]
MIGADVVRTLFALRGLEPFSRLDDAELLLIAAHARLRSYPAGRVILPAGQVAEVLVAQLSGAARAGEAAAPPVFDAAGLLFGLAAARDYVAGPEGLEALVIAKPHVFTIARECPEFVVGLRDLAERAGA